MNILAVDYGKKRLGLAWCDTAVGVVLPYGVIEKAEDQKLIDLVREEKIQKVVFGLPLGLDGKENENTQRVRDFAESLKGAIEVPIDFIDERFTSRLADAMGGDATRDEKAAMGILESYIARNS